MTFISYIYIHIYIICALITERWREYMIVYHHIDILRTERVHDCVSSHILRTEIKASRPALIKFQQRQLQSVHCKCVWERERVRERNWPWCLQKNTPLSSVSKNSVILVQSRWWRKVSIHLFPESWHSFLVLVLKRFRCPPPMPTFKFVLIRIHPHSSSPQMLAVDPWGTRTTGLP